MVGLAGLRGGTEQRAGRTKPETIYRFATDTIRIDPKNQARPFVTALARVYETFLRLASRHMVAALASRKRSPQGCCSLPRIYRAT